MAGQFGLTVDEAHYVLYGKIIDFSYVDHPPLVGWVQADLVQEWKDVVERADGVEGSSVLGSEGAPHDGEEERGFDLLDGNAAVVEDAGQAPIFGAGVSEGAGGAAVVVEDGRHVEMAIHEFTQPVGSRRDGPLIVTVWQ